MLYNSTCDSASQKFESSVFTGVTGLDIAFGSEGIPGGQIIEIFGEADSGKSALALHFAFAFQQAGREVAYFDSEGKLHIQFAAAIGVAVNDLLVGDSSYVEDVFDTAELLALGGAVGLIIIDSVTALLPKNELYGDANNLSQLDIICRCLRRLQIIAAKTGCCFLLLNQLRGDFEPITAGVEKSAGGVSIGYRAGVRIQLFNNIPIMQKNKCVGQNIRALIIKNSLTIKAISLWLVLYYSSGFSLIEGTILDALDAGVLHKQSEVIYFEDKALGCDRDAVTEFLCNSRDVYDKIVKALKDKYN